MSEPFSIRMPPDVQSVRIGEHQALLIDNFLERPEALVEAACLSRFELYPGMTEKKGYPGIRAAAPVAYSNLLVDLIDPLIKINYGVPEALALRKSECMFSLTTAPPDQLGPLQRTPHFDASTPHHMAVLLYLCDERHGGTGFYRHKATSLQRITADNRERYLDAYFEEINRRWPAPRYFDDSDEHFTFLGMLPARFNRLAIYPGSLLHSACINPKLSIESDPRRGRLTLNSFFDF